MPTRTQNTVRNTIVSVGGYLLYFIFGLAVRKLFLQNINIENLGYEGIFGNIFQILGGLDLGAGALLTYRLYQSISQNNVADTKRMMAMFASLYRIAALIIMLVGCALIPALHLIIKDTISDWGYVYKIYLIQLSGVAATCWLSYYRIFLEANQRASDAMIIETAFRIVGQIAKVIILITIQNYVAYLLSTVLTNVLTVAIIALIARRKQAYAFGGECKLADFQDPLFLGELKSGALIKVLNTVYYLADTILISAMIGLKAVALYSNYTLIGNALLMGFSKVLQPVGASIGNYVHMNSPRESFELFRILDLFTFYLATLISTVALVVFQPVIVLLFGQAYLLPESFVALYCAYFYIYIKDAMICNFRGAVGYYREEQMWAALSAIGNVAFSIVLGKLLGLTGIIAGTIISCLLYGTGKYVITFRHCFQKQVRGGLLIYFAQFLLSMAEMGVFYVMCRNLDVTFGGIIIRAVICMVGISLINTLIYFKTKTFRSALRFLEEKLRTFS